MTDPVPFHDLALKVLSGQSGEADRSALEALLRENPEWQREFAQLQESSAVLREVGPWLGEPPAFPGPIPPPPLERLRREVRAVFAARPEAPGGLDRAWQQVGEWAASLAGPARQRALAALEVLRSIPTDSPLLCEGGPGRTYRSDRRMMALPRQAELLPTELEEAAARRKAPVPALPPDEAQRIRRLLEALRDQLAAAEQRAAEAEARRREFLDQWQAGQDSAARGRAEMQATLAELDRLLARATGK